MVTTHETDQGTMLYDFSDRLEPNNVAYADSYPLVHRQLEGQRLVTHAFKDCPEQKQPMAVHAWDATSGWRTLKVPWVR